MSGISRYIGKGKRKTTQTTQSTLFTSGFVKKRRANANPVASTSTSFPTVQVEEDYLNPLHDANSRSTVGAALAPRLDAPVAVPLAAPPLGPPVPPSLAPPLATPLAPPLAPSLTTPLTPTVPIMLRPRLESWSSLQVYRVQRRATLNQHERAFVHGSCNVYQTLEACDEVLETIKDTIDVEDIDLTRFEIENRRNSCIYFNPSHGDNNEAKVGFTKNGSARHNSDAILYHQTPQKHRLVVDLDNLQTSTDIKMRTMLKDLCKAHCFDRHQLPDSYIGHGSSSQDDGLCMPLQIIMHSLCHTVDESPLGGGINCSGFLKAFMHQVVEIGCQEAHNLSEATSSMKELLWFDHGSFNNACKAVIELHHLMESLLCYEEKRELCLLLSKDTGVQCVMSWAPSLKPGRIELTPAVTKRFLGKDFVVDEDFRALDPEKEISDIFDRKTTNGYEYDFDSNESDQAVSFLSDLFSFRKRVGGVLVMDSNKHLFTPLALQQFFQDQGFTLRAKLQGEKVHSQCVELLMFVHSGSKEEGTKLTVAFVHPPWSKMADSSHHPPPDLVALQTAVIAEALHQLLLLLKSGGEKKADLKMLLLEAYFFKEYGRHSLHLDRKCANNLFKQGITSLNAFDTKYHGLTRTTETLFITHNNRKNDLYRQPESDRSNNQKWIYRFTCILLGATDQEQAIDNASKAIAYMRKDVDAGTASKRWSVLKTSGLLKGNWLELCEQIWLATRANSGNVSNHRSVVKGDTEEVNAQIEARVKDGAWFWLRSGPNIGKNAVMDLAYRVGSQVISRYGDPVLYTDENGVKQPVKFMDSPSLQIWGKDFESLRSDNAASSNSTKKGTTNRVRSVKFGDSHELRSFFDNGTHLVVTAACGETYALVRIAPKVAPTMAQSINQRADALITLLVKSKAYFWVGVDKPKALTKVYDIGEPVLDESQQPYLYYDQETKEKQEIIFGQKPQVEYGYLNIGTIMSKYFKNENFRLYLGSTHELQYIYIAPNSRTRLCINNKVLVRIVAKRKKKTFFSVSATAAAASGTAATTIPATATATTKVKRPSLSVKKAAPKVSKQISLSGFVPKGKENKSRGKDRNKEIDLISSDESMN